MPAFPVSMLFDWPTSPLVWCDRLQTYVQTKAACCRYYNASTAINAVLEAWVNEHEGQRVSYVDCSFLYIIENDSVCSFHEGAALASLCMLLAELTVNAHMQHMVPSMYSTDSGNMHAPRHFIMPCLCTRCASSTLCIHHLSLLSLSFLSDSGPCHPRLQPLSPCPPSDLPSLKPITVYLSSF